MNRVRRAFYWLAMLNGEDFKAAASRACKGAVVILNLTFAVLVAASLGWFGAAAWFAVAPFLAATAGVVFSWMRWPRTRSDLSIFDIGRELGRHEADPDVWPKPPGFESVPSKKPGDRPKRRLVSW